MRDEMEISLLIFMSQRSGYRYKLYAKVAVNIPSNFLISSFPNPFSTVNIIDLDSIFKIIL